MRDRSRINIGDVFNRWRHLREFKAFKTDEDLAKFLLDSYQTGSQVSTSTPFKKQLFAFPALSSIHGDLSERDFAFEEGVEVLGQGEVSISVTGHLPSSGIPVEINEEEYNRIENSILESDDDQTWSPSQETEDVSSSEEDWTIEMEESEDSNDEEYIPPYRIRTGATMREVIELQNLQDISEEDTLYDIVLPEAPHDDPVSIPDNCKVAVSGDIVGQQAAIVYHKCVQQLAEFLLIPITLCTAKMEDLSDCGAPAPYQTDISTRGTAMVVKWICPNDHVVWEWNSQPKFKFGMQSGDFMLATNILLSGNNYSKIALLFKYMNMGMVAKSTFYRIQAEYCHDVIESFWEEKRSAVIAEVHDRSVVALGDGRMDSPGFSAQYCTYTLMDNETKKIMSIKTEDKRLCGRISTIMEREAFIKSFNQLKGEVNLTEVCTDAHTQISALFRNGIFKDSGVEHTYDMWHGAKNLGKKIHAAGQQKGCSILLQWNKDICNHFWFCCNKANTYEEFFNMWMGLLHHVTGEHVWPLDACQHDPLESEREKEWLVKGSTAHNVLSEIILKERWLKEVPKYLKFRSTARLEAFHSHLLMYASKRFSYDPPIMDMRMQLAALDYNHHVHRPAKRNADGAIQYRKVFNKKSRCWRIYAIKVEKDYAYIPELQTMVVTARVNSQKGLPRQRKYRAMDPRRLGLLSTIPAPTTQELLEHQRTRGDGQRLPQK
ncbi:unnamed protein product [Knipowitschia caucasica]